ncbi:hypothetical protein H632_c44p1 [Helicosporidium sp. ATCC 50920]|nr:hypothetical protein H632_c44p1 [Helicosporidium sp. ATCC 50920]|eukprot:KDD76999.1 hypothetical protein H632_c44p1 [Helicosporidium sp. ATCC 50920]
MSRFQSTLSTADQEARMAAINTSFAEARDEIEYALEDAETTYFNESATTAQEAVKKTLDMYGELLALANEDDRARIQRSMGLKMEQLKAEVKQLDSLHA